MSETDSNKAVAPPFSARRRVALLVETSLGSGREILRGIAQFVHQNDSWELFHEVRSLHEAIPEWIRDWTGDGIIARVQNAEMVRALKAGGVPVVDVLGVVPDAGFPLVHVDDEAIAATVAEHFLQRDFRHFAFLGIAGENWSERRRDAFRVYCGNPASFPVLEAPRSPDEGSARSRAELHAWVRSLPQPVAIMVSSDQRGLALLEACRAEQISVPERVVVAGVDNDVPLCEISSPTLTSVRAGHFGVGYEAARLLETLMSGAAAPEAPVLIPPTGIVSRRSSDSRAIDDPVVAAGIHFIHENLGRPLSNDSIARAVGISRTLFQKRFRAAIEMTIRDYLVRQRLQRAQSLIENSNLTLAEIATRAGFRHQEYMGTVFKAKLGRTPASFR